MATRRQKLHDVLVQAAEAGVTVEDLVQRIEDFSASGESGIENFLDQTLNTFAPAPKQVDTATAVYYLQKAINVLS